MESSSSATSSSNSHYKGPLSFPASSSGRPRWPDLPIYDSIPHYPPMDNARFLPNSSSSYSTYANHTFAGGDGGGGGSGTADAAEKREEDESVAAVEREHMFDKVVTPSDVGKLNRLVIPKQHAEKYFPLDSNSSDSKGLLLNFEDRTGKSWRFRYSYWNSSQSYVMTKGWSRFVKEKKLDAGDVVSFHRGVGDAAARERFYIDWRRRPSAPPSHHYPLYRGLHSDHHEGIQFQPGFSLHRPIQSPYYLSPPIAPPGLHQAREFHQHRGSVVSYNGLTTNNYGTVSPNFFPQTGSVIYLGAAAAASPHHHHHHQIPMPPIQPTGISQRDEVMVFDSVPVVHGGKAASKRLRLFGVNMDCTDDEQQPNHPHQHDFVLDSDRISSSSSESALQLRLHGSGASAASTSGADKGCCSCRCFVGHNPTIFIISTESCRASKSVGEIFYYQLVDGDVWKLGSSERSGQVGLYATIYGSGMLYN